MRRLYQILRRAYVIAQTRRELYSMSDRMLRDIGLQRDQIRSMRFF